MSQALAPAPEAQAAISTIVVKARPAPHHSAFHELLSELNPLQYIPVVGTIYRALTGDKISDDARTIGSLVLSGITGGPVGVAVSVAAMAAEKATGIDPEDIGQKMLAKLGIGEEKPAVQTTPLKPAATLPQPGPSLTMPASAWSAAQLTAYGVTTSPGGSLTKGNLAGSDVLNGMELARLASTEGAT
jgi:hypothetical protein